MRKNAIVVGQIVTQFCHIIVMGMDKVSVKCLIIKMMKLQFRLGERL